MHVFILIKKLNLLHTIKNQLYYSPYNQYKFNKAKVNTPKAEPAHMQTFWLWSRLVWV